MSELKVNKLSPESGTTLTLGDAGDTIVNNGTASGFLPTAGSDGNILTSDGTNWASEAPAAGGAWAVKSSGNFSGVANLDITGISKTTKIILGNIIHTGGATFQGELSVNNGSSWTDVQYQNTVLHLIGNTNTPDGIVGGHSTLIFTHTGTLNQGDRPSAAEIIIYEPQISSTRTSLSWQFQTCTQGGNVGVFCGSGSRQGTGAVNAIRFKPSNANFSGTYVVLELN